MAAGILPKPGSKYGPCLEPCQHRDCAETRREARSRCLHCGGLIGYETRFYKNADHTATSEERFLVHAECEERKTIMTAYFYEFFPHVEGYYAVVYHWENDKQVIDLRSDFFNTPEEALDAIMQDAEDNNLEPLEMV